MKSVNNQYIQLLIELNTMCLCVNGLTEQIFFPHLLLCSFEKLICKVAMATACVQAALYKEPHTPHPSLFLSGVFAFPFNQRHLFLRGLTGQKQEMQIMLTVMPIITNAKTLDARLSIANGPMGFVGKQLNSLT